MFKNYATALLSLLLCLGIAQVAQAQSNIHSDKLAPTLVRQLEIQQGVVPVYIMLERQADGYEAKNSAAARGASKREQTQAAVEHVRTFNTKAQAPVLAALKNISGITNLRSRWLVNMIAFDADAATISQIAAMPEVAGIFYDGAWEPEVEVENSPSVVQPNGVEPGHLLIKADKLWSLGYTGFGGIAFTADTGVDPFHPAINHKYAGLSQREASWYDFDLIRTAPFDCDDHGTHVNGTILGLDRQTNDTIGVAPGAHWIGGAILCGRGTSDNIGAFEWAIDPDGDASTDSDRPVVINNSWRDPGISDIECSSSNPYPVVLNNLMSAGIAVVFSAGNAGPEPATITPPHNYNAGIVNAFTVGALAGRGIAGFSSRGPALCLRDSTPLDIKPEISAPGSNVRSCLPGGGYGNKSGTSMAAPHVAGAILLLHEAFPNLMGEELQLALYFSAEDVGDAGEDNTFGNGIIDVEAAYNYLIAQGNTPVAPDYPSVALQVEGISAPQQQCGGTFSFSTVVRNSGSVVINNIEWSIYVNGELKRRIVSDSIYAAGELRTLNTTTTISQVGEVYVEVVATQINGLPADPRLDLGGTFEVEVSANNPPVINMLADESSICAGSPVLLELMGSQTDPTVSYFSDITAGNLGDPAATGPFVIDSLEESVTLYGLAEYIREGGPATPAIPTVVYDRVNSHTMLFTALENCRIRSFNIISEEAGRVRISLNDASQGGRLARVSELVPAGVSRVYLGGNLIKGRLYEIEFSSGDLGYVPDLNIRGNTFAGLININNVQGPNPGDSGSSFFFFDYEFGYPDGCPAVPITLNPDASRTATQLRVTANIPTVEQTREITFTQQASAPTTDHVWYVEDTRYDTDMPIQTVTARDLGIQTAQVFAQDNQNCSSYGTTEFEVVPLSSGVEGLAAELLVQLSPNPATTHIRLLGDIDGVTRIRILDVLGRQVHAFAKTSDYLDLPAMSNGSYILELSLEDNSIATFTFVKQ